MPLIRVGDDDALFLDVPDRLHRDDPCWIRPDDADVRAVFDGTRNAALAGAEVARWVLMGDAPLGRIAAYHRPGAEVGGLGFFACVDDPRAAALLFDTGRAWLAERGATALDAPINFGEHDRFWGLLVHGFLPPSPLENYNPPYYEALFEGYGLRRWMDHLTYRLPLDRLPEARLARAVDALGRRRALAITDHGWSDLDAVLADLIAIYQASFSTGGARAHRLEAEDLRALASLQDTLRRSRLLLARVDGRPAGFLLFLRHDDGPPGVPPVKAFAFAVHPDFRRRGVDAALTLHLLRSLRASGDDALLLAGIGSHTAPMVALARTLGATVERVHRTYRLHLDGRPVHPLAPGLEQGGGGA